MKVLIVTASAGFLDGEAENDTLARHALYLEHLQRLEPGSELRVLVLSRAGPQASGWTAAGPLRVACLGASGAAGLALRMAAMVLAPPSRLFADWRPDLVTSQSPFEDGLASLLLARRLGARHLAQVHFRREMIASDFRPAARALLPAIVLRATDRTRFVGERQRLDFVAAYRLNPTHSFVAPVPMMAQVGVRDASPMPAGDRAPICLYAGRLVASKRMDVWMAAAARVAADIPDASFVVAGDGPARGQAEALAAQAGLGERIRFTGELAPGALAELYGRAGVLLLASDTDAFGRVVVEAGAFGVPVVSTACGGPEEIILDGQTGLLRRRGDAEGLAAGVARLLADPALATRMGEAARVRVHALYDADTLAARLADEWRRTARPGAR